MDNHPSLTHAHSFILYVPTPCSLCHKGGEMCYVSSGYYERQFSVNISQVRIRYCTNADMFILLVLCAMVYSGPVC